MTFREFSRAIKKDERLMELLNRCEPSSKPLTKEETNEMIEHTKNVAQEMRE